MELPGEENMKVTIVGTGYVGLVTGTCFSEMGNQVTCVDIDDEKLKNLRRGIIPIHEPGLEELIDKNTAAGRLTFSNSLADSLVGSAIAFIAVGTPSNEDGSADLSHVLAVARQIGENMVGPILVVDKSTVPVGTADLVEATITKALESRGVDISFEVVSNPEFLKEGAAVQDFMSPDRIVVGVKGPNGNDLMRELYAPFSRTKDKMHFMGIRDAEMTKYAANAMLATKISFMNEIALLCESYGVDVEQVRKGIGSDSRIGYSFIYPGAGYGGSCFPKDVRALASMAREKSIESYIFDAVERRNNEQKMLMFQKLVDYFGDKLRDCKIAVWGLSFKPETDDVREAPSLTVIGKLLELGVKVQAYDPKAAAGALQALGDVGDQFTIGSDMYEVLEGADALLLMTEWKEFRQPDFELIKQKLNIPLILDGRNVYDPDVMHRHGFVYAGVGRGAQVAAE
ncbi:MAG: UDPglucose 6-dehydrogenase [Candidatus Azotimanducaceae bacterium]